MTHNKQEEREPAHVLGRDFSLGVTTVSLSTELGPVLLTFLHEFSDLFL